MESTLLQAMQQRLVDGLLPCTQAMAVAATLNVEPAAIGLAANRAGIRISHCQLGLFGYGPKAEGKHKILHVPTQVPEAIAHRLREASTGDGIACATLWQVASEMRIGRLEAAGAAEALGLRVSICQLGCFPRPTESR